MTRIVSLVIACGVFVIVLAAPSSAAASRGITLTDQVIAAANREAVNLHSQPQTGSASQPAKKSSKRKAVLIGAAIGGGIGAAYGAHYCRSDCGGGRPRGAQVFGLAGAGIGAVGGYIVALIADHGGGWTQSNAPGLRLGDHSRDHSERVEPKAPAILFIELHDAVQALDHSLINAAVG